jgi:hypothetical protein
MRIVLALLSILAASPAAAQRPVAFYLLSPSAPPEAELERLPPDARDTYARILRLKSARSAASESLPEGATRRARVTRLSEALDAAWSVLRRTLERDRAALDARGWLLLGEARIRDAQSAWLAGLEAYDRDPGHAPEPVPVELAVAIDALRMASALASDAELGGWARYLEATCLIEMERAMEADIALRLVAASGPRALRGEARLRLATIATAAGEPARAAAWLERALPDARPEIAAFIVYDLAWARFRAGQHEAMRAAIARLPADAPPELREDLAELARSAP